MIVDVTSLFLFALLLSLVGSLCVLAIAATVIACSVRKFLRLCTEAALEEAK
jgi:hypothetical protein